MKIALILSTLLFSAFSLAQGPTLADWKKLTPEAKLEAMESVYMKPAITLKGQSYIFEDPNGFTVIQKKAIALYMKTLKTQPTSLETSVEDDFYGQVGSVETRVSFYFSDLHEILAAEEFFLQRGCSHETEDGEFIEMSAHYKTEAQANKKGCIDNDVSWSGYAYRGEDAQELSTSEFMEWSGH